LQQWVDIKHHHNAAVVTLEATLGVDGEVLLWTGSEDGTLSLFRVSFISGAVEAQHLGTYGSHQDTVGCLLLPSDPDLVRFRLKGVTEGVNIGRFEIGDRVEAQYGDADEGWFPGRITGKKREEGGVQWLYSISYDDGDTEDGVGEALVAFHAEACKSNQSALPLIFSGSGDGEVHLVDSELLAIASDKGKSAARLLRFRGHTSVISSMALSSSEMHLFTSSYDRTIRVWSVANGSCLNAFEGGTFGSRCIMICGAMLFTVCEGDVDS